MQGGAEEETVTPSLRRGAGGEPCRTNCLINTHRLGAEPQEAHLFQGHMVSVSPQQEHSGTPPQLLNPRALLPHHVVPEPTLRPGHGFLLCPDSILHLWGEAGGGDCCETTFIEGHGPDVFSSSTKEVLLFADGKFLEFSGEDTRIPTLSYDIEDDNDFQEVEVRRGSKRSSQSQDVLSNSKQEAKKQQNKT